MEAALAQGAVQIRPEAFPQHAGVAIDDHHPLGGQPLGQRIVPQSDLTRPDWKGRIEVVLAGRRFGSDGGQQVLGGFAEHGYSPAAGRE